MKEGGHGSAPLLLKAALAYAKRGVPVFPCEPGAKKPLTCNGHWDATTDPRAIERWWKRWPTANVGVPTGKKSGLVVLDVDLGAGAADPPTFGFERRTIRLHSLRQPRARCHVDERLRGVMFIPARPGRGWRRGG